jgi:hypothetical protein
MTLLGKNAQVHQGRAFEHHYHCYFFPYYSAVVYARVCAGRRVAGYGQWPCIIPGTQVGFPLVFFH